MCDSFGVNLRKVWFSEHPEVGSMPCMRESDMDRRKRFYAMRGFHEK
jgi:hypothetical protein